MGTNLGSSHTPIADTQVTSAYWSHLASLNPLACPHRIHPHPPSHLHHLLIIASYHNFTANS